MDMLSTALNRVFGLVSASVEDGTKLLNAIKSGRFDVKDLERWYSKRRRQGLETLDAVGVEIRRLRRQAMATAGMAPRRGPRRSGLRRRAGRRHATVSK